MNSDPGSLDNLQDIIEPDAVSWWPPAIGWWVVAGLLLVAAAWFLFRAICRWQSDAYRRAALGELQSANSSAAVSEILKRTALAAYPRTDVASLSGPAWCRWLGETSGLQLSGEVQQGLSDGVFRSTDAGQPKQLREFASQWIRCHNRSVAGGTR